MVLLFFSLWVTHSVGMRFDFNVIVFLRRKAMTNLDSVLKSRDISFLTKVHIVKAMVFPVIMYGCES